MPKYVNNNSCSPIFMFFNEKKRIQNDSANFWPSILKRYKGLEFFGRLWQLNSVTRGKKSSVTLMYSVSIKANSKVFVFLIIFIPTIVNYLKFIFSMQATNIWQNLPLFLWHYNYFKAKVVDFIKFCSLLGKY